ncbi:hypothetical protein V5799_028705 [Amblyomma americanum]|uniref:DUF4590 domain-containing protein n=1 Tax=Amblyomma americanum TaxID=6943 RepID=A0AAQ4DC39_AMBAM
MVAAAHKKTTGPIDSYDSLNDEHLRPHFHKSLVRQRLARVGLVRCLRHDGKPNGAHRCTCASSVSGSRGSTDASTTSSGDSGVSLNNADLTCSTCRSNVAAPPTAPKEPVSPYLLPVNPSSKRKLAMPRPTQQGNTAPRITRRASITPAGSGSSSGRGEPLTKNHFPKKSDCKVSLLFHGSSRRVVAEARQPVRVTQQHCGGTSLTVYDGRVAPGDTFTFASRRHCGYPFSIVIFVDDMRDVQLSSCCEYRYHVGVRLGGSQGHFSLVRIEGGSPCYRCVLEKRLKALPKEEPRPMAAGTAAEDSSSGLSSPITSSSEVANEESADGSIQTSASSATEDYHDSEDEGPSVGQESGDEAHEDIVDIAEKEAYSSGTNCSTETLSSPSLLPTSGSEDVQEQIEGDDPSRHEQAQADSSSGPESNTSVVSNSFEPSSNGENSGEKSGHNKTGSLAKDEGQSQSYKASRSVVQSSAYFVQDKKKQWGSDEVRGESFSSDDDAQTVTLTVQADVHSTP